MPDVLDQATAAFKDQISAFSVIEHVPAGVY